MSNQFLKGSFSVVYLNKLYNSNINDRHLTAFALNYIYFKKIAFVVTI